jgi:hypothetical protein
MIVMWRTSSALCNLTVSSSCSGTFYEVTSNNPEPAFSWQDSQRSKINPKSLVGNAINHIQLILLTFSAICGKI